MKYRRALLDNDVEIIRETVIGIHERYEIEIERMGTDNDHIPLYCSRKNLNRPASSISWAAWLLTCTGENRLKIGEELAKKIIGLRKRYEKWLARLGGPGKRESFSFRIRCWP